MKQYRDWDDEKLREDWEPKYETSPYEEIDAFACGSGEGEGFRYQTLSDHGPKSSSDHGSALLGMSLWTRMCSILAMRSAYEQQKVKYYIAIDDAGPIFGILKRTLATSQHRLGYNGVLQSAVQLHMQISWFGMLMYMTRMTGQYDHDMSSFSFFWLFTDFQMLGSIVTSLFFYGKNAYENWKDLEWARQQIHKDEDWGRVMAPFADWKKILRCELIKAYVWFAFYVFFGVWAFAKLIAVFACPCSMLNLNGCADIPPICIGDTL